MPSILLSPFTLRARRRRKPDTPHLPLGALAPGDLFNEIEAFLRALQNKPAVDEGGETLLGVSELDVYPRARRIEGLFETGHYGYSSRLVHSETLDSSYDRTEEDAELLPYFFLFYLPKKPDQGILILQRLGGWGVKSVLEGEMTTHFKSTPHLVEMHPVIPNAMVERLKAASRARRIRLVSFQVPRDIAGAFAKGDRDELCADLVIRASGRRTFKLPSSLQALLHGNRKVGGFVEAQGEFPHSRVQVEAVVGGKGQKVSFDQRGRDMTGYHDVSGRVAVDAGHPTYPSIRREARELLKSLKSEIQWVEPAEWPPPGGPCAPGDSAAPAVAEQEGHRRTG